jgi:hypothetical protein
MIQVFRDCCREAAHADGAVGLGRYWLIALGDLIVSALAERRREEMHMSRTAWIRLGSLAAIIGGVTAVLLQIPNIAVIMTSYSGRIVSPIESLYLQREAWEATPVLWLLIVLALIGLQAGEAGRANALGRIGATLGIIGAVLIGVGDAVTSAVSRSQFLPCTPPLCTFYDNNNYTVVSQIVVLLGAVLFAVGMILYSIAAIRSRVLARRWANALPLVVGLLVLLSNSGLRLVPYAAGLRINALGGGIDLLLLPPRIFVSSAPIITSGSGAFADLSVQPVRDLIFTAITSIMMALFLVLLGVIMWPGKQEEPVMQTKQVEPMAG